MEPNNERKTPAGEQNELFKKQVFSDETLRTADPDEEETGEQHFETLTFDKPAVLDERFAARKAERETAQPPQAKPAAPRPAAKPVKRQVPAAQKNKSVSHERRLYRRSFAHHAADCGACAMPAACVRRLLGKGHCVGHLDRPRY